MIPHSKPTLSALDSASLNDCLKGGNLAKGTLVSAFEQELKTIFNSQHCIVTNSGSAAIFLALKAIGINNAAQEVLLPTYVCESVLNAILLAGASPVFYDNGPDWISDYETIKDKVTAKTSAIIAVHTMGIIMKDIKNLSKLNIPIIEDCCQCFGGVWKENKAGSFGDFAVFSFQATKCLTTGEGGGLLVNNRDFVKPLNEIYTNFAGFFNFSDLQASLGLSQLKQYNGFLRRRKEIAEIYFSMIKYDAIKAFKNYEVSSIKYRFLLRLNQGNFEKIKNDFQQVGISVRKGVDDLLHKRYHLPDSLFPNATVDFHSSVSIPIYPEITDEEAIYISTQVNNIL